MRSQIFLKMSELFDTLVRPAGESGDVDTLLLHIAETARVHLSTSACAIQARNPITGRFREPLIVSQQFPSKCNQAFAAFLRSEELTCAVIRQKIVLIEDLDNCEEFEPALLATLKNIPDTRAVVVLSLCMKERHKTLGTLYLSYSHPQRFSIDDFEHFQIFADQVSLVLQEAWLRLRYREVARIGQYINHELSDEHAIFTRLKDHIGSILDADYALLLAVYKLQSRKLDIYQAEEGRLVVDPNHEFEGACQYVIETKQPLFIRQRSEEARELPFQIALMKGTKPEESLIFVPLMLLGEPIGVLSIQHPLPDAYTQEDQFILELLANHVALALYNARLYRNLKLLHDTGQILTQQFESASTPQNIVDNIRKATRADLVVLYPYDAIEDKFVQPVCIAGTLLDPGVQVTPHPVHEGSITRTLLERRETIFARKSDTLYTSLGDGVSAPNTRFYLREKVCSTAAVPLLVEEKVVGVLFVNFRQPQRFDPTQKVLIEGLAHYAAIAIKNAQTFGRLSERRIHELEILQKIDSALNTPDPELKTVLNTILSLAHEQIHPNDSGLLLYDPRKRVWTFGAANGPSAVAMMALPFIAVEQKGIISWVLQHKKTALVKNVYQELPWRDVYLKFIDETIAELDVPLLDDGQVIGVLSFGSATEGAFDQEDALFLETLAGQAIIAIKKAQAYEREKRFAERFRLLYEAGQELGKITEMDQLNSAYQTIVRLAQELSHSPVVIRRYDEKERALILAYTSWHRYSPPSLKLDISAGFNGKVARERRTIVVDDVDSYPPGEFLQRPADPTIRSILVTPILFKDRYYGNLELTHESVAHFHDKDQEFFEGLALQLASTLDRLEITQERQELKQRAQAAEVMISSARSTYELTHRLGNDFGLVEFWVTTIKDELKKLNADSPLISERLRYINEAAGKVMSLSERLRAELSSEEEHERFVLLPPQILLEDVRGSVSLPNNIQVRLEVEEGVAPVRVIHRLIANALLNLVINAKEAMPQGGLLTLRARNRGRSVALEVIDTGVGIPKEHQSKIFELLFSTKSSSGFGLWSAQNNTWKNRGTLKVESEPNRGTTFTLLLPRAEEH